MSYTEKYFVSHSIKGFQLFTGKENKKAETFYDKIDYKKTKEFMYKKRL